MRNLLASLFATALILAVPQTHDAWAQAQTPDDDVELEEAPESDAEDASADDMSAEDPEEAPIVEPAERVRPATPAPPPAPRVPIVITIDPALEEIIEIQPGSDGRRPRGEERSRRKIQQEIDEIEDELERERAERDAIRRDLDRAKDAQRLRADKRRRSVEDDDLTNQVKIELDGNEGEIVRLGRSLRIDEDDIVDEAVVIGGNMRVHGEVEGDAVVIGGNMTIADGAVVGGDAVVVGGRLSVAPGGYVEGQRVQIGVFSPFVGVLGDGGNSFMDLVSSFLLLLLLLFIGGLLNMIMGGRLDVMAGAVKVDALKSALVGFLVLILWLPVVVLSAVTVVGIPVAIVVLIALPLALIPSFYVGCQALGRRFGPNLRFQRQSSLGYLLVGTTVIWALSFLGKALGLLGDALYIFALGFGLTSTFLGLMAAVVGLGALTVTRFGSRPAGGPDLGSLPVPGPPAPPGLPPIAPPGTPASPPPIAELSPRTSIPPASAPPAAPAPAPSASASPASSEWASPSSSTTASPQSPGSATTASPESPASVHGE